WVSSRWLSSSVEGGARWRSIRDPEGRPGRARRISRKGFLMVHETKLIALIAVGFVLATALGVLAARAKLPPLLGYLLAGVAIGPFTSGFIADADLASVLAEIGVILLMFGVGLHFSIDTLRSIRRIAVPGAVAQMAVATGIGTAFALWWGWNLTSGIV